MRPLAKALIASGAILVALTLAAAVFVVVDRSDDPDPRSLQVERPIPTCSTRATPTP